MDLGSEPRVQTDIDVSMHPNGENRGSTQQSGEHEHEAAPHVCPEANPKKPSAHKELLRDGFDLSLLSEKFFEEGDLQEATNFENLPHEPERKRRSTAHLEFDSFDRIPTRRKPMLVAMGLLVLSIGGVVWWAGASNPTAAGPPSAIGQPGESTTVGSPDRVTSPLAAPAATPEPVAAAVSTSSVSATPEAVVPRDVMVLPELTLPLINSPPVTAAPAETDSPPAVDDPPAAASSLVEDESPNTEAAAMADVEKVPPVKKKTPPAPNAAVANRPSGPLMLWSPEKQMMVPAEEIAGTSAIGSAPKAAVARRPSGPLMLWSPEKQMMVPAEEIAGTSAIR